MDRLGFTPVAFISRAISITLATPDASSMAPL